MTASANKDPHQDGGPGENDTPARGTVSKPVESSASGDDFGPGRLSRVKSDFEDGLELQIAIDGMIAGNMEPLKRYLADLQGLDPDRATLRIQPWKAPDVPTNDLSPSKVDYLGKVDDIYAPDDERSQRDKPLDRPVVHFDVTSTPFTYSGLEKREFRLMRLAPPDADGVTHEIEVKTFSLDDAPPFYCLSYVWGNPKRFLPLTCNGGRILVTQNLYHALRSCFNRFSNSWLWADGLCINQEDINERSQQVMLMGEIYSKASMVLAHPGHYAYGISEEQDEASGLYSDVDKIVELQATSKLDLAKVPTAAFDVEMDGVSTDSVQAAISIMTYLKRIWDSSPDFEIKSDAEWRKYKLPDPNTKDGATVWVQLIEFWSVDWFCRAWVLQELVLAKKVVILYGMTAFSLDAVMEFWSKAQTRGLPRHLRLGVLADWSARIVHLSPVSSLKTLIKQRARPDDEGQAGDQSGDEESETAAESDEQEHSPHNEYPKPAPEEVPITKQSSHFLDLLAITRTNQATDHRDKVYALLGLVDDSISQSIVPDYSFKNPVNRLYTEVARKFVEAGLGPKLLHLAGVTTQTHGLPTWVPDWTTQTRSRMTPELYNCMGSTKPALRLIDAEGEKPKLVVRGVVLSTLKMVALAWRYYSHGDAKDTFSKFLHRDDLDIPPFNDEDGRNVVLAMALRVDTGSAAKRYSQEGFENAVARTLAMDRSWRGEKIGRVRDSSPKSTLVPTKPARSSDEEVHNAQNDDTPLLGADTVTSGTEEQPVRDVAAEFLDAFAAFRAFYKKGPDCPADEKMPGIRVHQTHIFKWLLSDMDQATEDELQQRMVPYAVAMQESSKGRRFATLAGKSIRQKKADKAAGKTQYDMDDRAFIASVPYDAEKKDLVVMLEGFSTPFVLRKASTEGEYQLVGDCYVHGVMDGELLRNADEPGVQLQDNQVICGDDGQTFGVRVPDGFGTVQEFTIC